MREGVNWELLREGREERNEGGEAGREEHGVMDGVKEEGKAQMEINDGGEAGRGRAWNEGGSEGQAAGMGRHEGGEAGRERAWREEGSE